MLKPHANPWKTLEQKVIYENPFLRVRVDRVIKPDGKPGFYSVTDSGHSNIVIPVTDEWLFYIVSQWRYPREYYSWEFPGGKKEKDENSLETAARELLEETGLVAESLKLIGTLDLLSGMSENVYDVLLAEKVRQTKSISNNEDGIHGIRAVTLKELLSLMGNEIKNAQSMAALMLYISSDPRVARKCFTA